MNLYALMRSKLHNAIRRYVSPRPPAVGRVRVPLTAMPRVREWDGDTAWIPRAGSPGVNARPYTPRHRSADVVVNRVPARFARERVA